MNSLFVEKVGDLVPLGEKLQWDLRMGKVEFSTVPRYEYMRCPANLFFCEYRILKTGADTWLMRKKILCTLKESEIRIWKTPRFSPYFDSPGGYSITAIINRERAHWTTQIKLEVYVSTRRALGSYRATWDINDPKSGVLILEDVDDFTKSLILSQVS